MNKSKYNPSTFPAPPAYVAGTTTEKSAYSTKRISHSDEKFYNIQLNKPLDKSSSPHPKKFSWFFKRRASIHDCEAAYDDAPEDSQFRQYRSASVPSLAFGFSDQESMGDYMEAHILAALKRTSFNRLTMTFQDPEKEREYNRYFLDRSQLTWGWFSVIALVMITAVQVLLTKYYPEIIFGESITADMILVWVGGVLPMAVLILINRFLNRNILAQWIHVLSAVFLLILGPVQICARYFIANKEKYPPSLTSPVYILILVATVFFFRMRFLVTVVSMVISIGVWLAVFGLSISGHLHGDGLLTSFTTSAFGLLIGAIVICFIAYERERGFRFQYLSDSRFLRINNKLQRQLKGLQSNYTNRIADLESPLEKAILGMKSLMASPQISADQLETLDMIMSCLNSPNLLTPDLENQVTCGQVALDSEQEKWLFNGVAQRKESTIDIPEAQLPQLKVSIVGGVVSDATIDMESFRTPEAERLLENVAEFNFDIFAFEKATNGNPLLVLADHLIVKSGLLGRLGLPEDKFLRFISTLEAGYHKDLAFHNSLHASDVLHCINYLVTRPNLYKLFTDIELLGIYMSAAMHDFDHPGVNNQFLIATNDPRALLYNDKSVLENHHCANSFQVLARPECNFLAGIDRQTYKKLREQIVDMILATDLAQHFSLVALFKKKVMTASTFDPENTREDRTLLLQMMIKCADVSNPTKSYPLYEEWIHRIIAEWYVQGDKERELGLPISAFCNRDAPPAPAGVHPHQSSQQGFIEFIVAPMFEAFATWTDIEVVQAGLESNRARWTGEKKVAVPPPAVRKGSVGGR